MTLRMLAEMLGLVIRVGADYVDREVRGGYASDLLSDVIAHSEAGDIWVTLQAHENVVAVASLRELAGIVLVGGREPDLETARRAEMRGIPILLSPQRTFEVVARLVEAGVPRRCG